MYFPSKQKLYGSAALVLLLGGASYVGLRQLRPDAPLSVVPISGSPPPSLPTQDSKPIETPTPTPVESKAVVVAMAGAVKIPGLLHLTSDDRVGDAIKRAGGAKPEADLDRINLAARLVDGDQVYVPYKKATGVEKSMEVAKVSRRHRGGEVAFHFSPLPPAMPPALRGAPILSPLPPDRSSPETPRETSTLPEPDAPNLDAPVENDRPVEPRHRTTKAKATGPVSLNSANEAELETLPGVGPATAQKILDYRREHGGFHSIDEMLAIRGIGDKKLAKMRPYLTL